MKKWEWFFAGIAVVILLWVISSCRLGGLSVEADTPYGNATIIVEDGEIDPLVTD